MQLQRIATRSIIQPIVQPQRITASVYNSAYCSTATYNRPGIILRNALCFVNEVAIDYRGHIMQSILILQANITTMSAWGKFIFAF